MNNTVLFIWRRVLLPVLLGMLCLPAWSQSITDCRCHSLWRKDAAREMVELLEQASRQDVSVWPGLKLGQGAIVLNAGTKAKGKHCLGVWQGGENKGYFCSSDVPAMLTPLYSYFYATDTITSDYAVFAEAGEEAPAFSQWMEQLSIDRAVYMPVSFPDFPFELTALNKVQLAIHESFHVEVMLPYWFTGTGPWPGWDRQPDRPGVQSCYTHSDTVTALIQREKSALGNMVEALLSQKKEEAIKAGEQVLQWRAERYEWLDTVTVALQDGSPGSCATVEAIMELEEGMADYGSWTKLYEAGVATPEQLLQRYRATQKDHFYLTGAMFLHAISLMRSGDVMPVIQRIITSTSVEEGSLQRMFAEALREYRKG